MKKPAAETGEDSDIGNDKRGRKRRKRRRKSRPKAIGDIRKKERLQTHGYGDMQAPRDGEKARRDNKSSSGSSSADFSNSDREEDATDQGHRTNQELD